MSNKEAFSSRQYKVAEQIKKLTSSFFQRGKFKAIDFSNFVTISEVRISQDLRNATIFASELGGSSDEKEFLSKLQLLVPELKKYIASNIKLRYCPNLHFSYDDLYDKARYIEDIFQTIKLEDEQI